MISLTSALMLISLAMATSLVACTSDAKDQVVLKPCTYELTVGCTKPSEPDAAAKIGQKHKPAGQEKAIKLDPIVALMDEISRLKQELIPTMASTPSNSKKVKSASAALPVSNQPASIIGPTICEKSLAVGTLGYRILCQPSKETLAAQVNEKQKQQSQEMTQVARRETTDGAAMPQERADFPEQAEAGELRRLRSLFEQLDKRGNFRPIVQSSSLQ